MDSPCYLSAKPGILTAHVSSHQYLSGAAISPLACIHQTLRPNGSLPTCIGNGDFLSFYLYTSWRTSPLLPSACFTGILILTPPSATRRYAAPISLDLYRQVFA